MLTLGDRDGRGRIATWTVGEASTATPALLHVDHPQAPRNGQQLVLTANPIGEGLEIVSQGTWFHPSSANGALVMPPMAPSPTTEVQVFTVDDLAIWHDAGGWCNNPQVGVPALMEARKKATAGKVLYGPALGYPHNYAVWAYAGIDLFDASNLHLAAIRGLACTMDGIIDAKELGLETTQDILQFNLDTAEQELATIRRALKNGNLRDLAERRSYADPSAVAVLRRLDRQYHYLEATTPQDVGDVRCMTPEAVNRPDVERFRRKLQDYTPPAEVLVLLPCSARKPYRLSKTHRYFQRALDESGGRHNVHEVMVTSPMGLVPRELEEVAPANRYDVPVTGKWSEDEREMIRGQLATLLDQGNYTHVIAHIDQQTFDDLRDLIPDALHSAMGRPSSIEDCVRLKEAVKNVCGGGDVISLGKARKLRDMEAIASFQFGSAGAARLLEGANAKGKVPYVKLFDGEEQLGMNRADRSFISLTLAGAKKLGDALPCITIGDFELTSKSLFSAGVEAADPRIRAGDEVGILQGGKLIASGVADLSAEEMLSVPRGIAAKLRHIHKEVA